MTSVMRLAPQYTKTTSQLAAWASAAILSLVLLAPTTVKAASISESFSSDEDLVIGAVISINQADTSKVELASDATAPYIAGVVTENTSGLITVSNNGDNVFAAVAGETSLLVSDINGEIKSGDLLIPSIIEGVAMKSSSQDNEYIIGVALQDFDSSSDSNNTETIDGQDVAIGSIQSRLLLGEVSPVESSGSLIENIGTAITGEQVQSYRVIISSAIFLAGIIASSIMLFGAIKGSFNSLGRNPLAAKSIYSSLFRVTLISSGIMLATVLIAYVVLVI